MTAEYLEMGDISEVAVRASSRNQARMQISNIASIPYIQTKVRKVYMRPCDCVACLAGHADDFHGYDEFWVHCSKNHPAAIEWWIG